MKPYIKLVLVRADGHRSEGAIKGVRVNAAMVDAAEGLVYAMDFGTKREAAYLSSKQIAAIEAKRRRWLKGSK